MKRKNNLAKKNISLFEIFILIASILAFSYFVGNEFKFVGASDTGGTSGGSSVTQTAVTAGAAAAGTALITGQSEAVTAAAATASTAALPTSAGTELGNILTPYGTTNAGTAPLATGSLDTVVSAEGGFATAGGEAATPAAAQSGKWMQRLTGSFNVILVNAAIAAGIYGVFYLISLIPGTDADAWKAAGEYLSIGYSVGAGAYILSHVIFGGAIKLGTSILFGTIGLGVGLLVFLLFYSKKKFQAVQFNCNQWQPSTGGGPNGRDDCVKCNQGQFPCTKYKCQSLGLNCELLNEGTSNEVCIWNNRNDIEPPVISSWKEILPEGYAYTPDSARLPPDKGVIIKANTSDGCVSPFTKLTYGITLDKPGMCKIDTIRTNSFANMTLTLSQGYYLYNHSILTVPAGIQDENGTRIEVSVGGNYETFVRCQSKNGYSNVGTFVFKYCVQDTPDMTAPSIEVVNPSNNMPTQFGSTSKKIDVYVNKPATCKWSHLDQSYDDMPETMNCESGSMEMNANLLYHCTTNLTGIRDRVNNDFYFRCKSYPGNPENERYANTASYKYTLIGTEDLVIDSISPEDGSTIKDASQSVKVNLNVKTSAGYKDGEAICSYSDTSGTNNRYVIFANTNSYESTQELWLDTGSYTYTIKCCDLGGNCKTQATTFTVESDNRPPLVVRAYNDFSQLKIVTEEDATCVYDTTSCNYKFDDGLPMMSSDKRQHTTTWSVSDVFYIKCKDIFGNAPSQNECNFIARPVNSY
jgi:hypothetical protein